MAITFEQLPRTINKVAKEIEFAAVVSLTRTVVLAQKKVRESLDKNFTLRNTFTKKGIRIKPATKKDKTAEVFSLDWFIAQHEKGETRVKPSETPFLIEAFIRDVAGISEKKRIPKRLRPENVLNKRVKGRQPVILKTRKGTRGIFLRTDDAFMPLRLLYTIQDEPIKIKARPWFFKPVDEAFAQFPKINDKAVKDALAKIKV